MQNLSFPIQNSIQKKYPQVGGGIHDHPDNHIREVLQRLGHVADAFIVDASVKKIQISM
jgi:hypothetical protein